MSRHNFSPLHTRRKRVSCALSCLVRISNCSLNSHLTFRAFISFILHSTLVGPTPRKGTERQDVVGTHWLSRAVRNFGSAFLTVPGPPFKKPSLIDVLRVRKRWWMLRETLNRAQAIWQMKASNKPCEGSWIHKFIANCSVYLLRFLAAIN